MLEETQGLSTPVVTPAARISPTYNQDEKIEEDNSLLDEVCPVSSTEVVDSLLLPDDEDEVKELTVDDQLASEPLWTNPKDGIRAEDRPVLPYINPNCGLGSEAFSLIIDTNAPALRKMRGSNTHPPARLILEAIWQSFRLGWSPSIPYASAEPTGFNITTRGGWTVSIGKEPVWSVFLLPNFPNSRVSSDFLLVEGTTAENLFNGIKHAQEVLRGIKSLTDLLHEPSTADWQETEEFGESSLCAAPDIADIEIKDSISLSELTSKLDEFMGEDYKNYEVPLLNLVEASRDLKEWHRLPPVILEGVQYSPDSISSEYWVLWTENNTWLLRVSYDCVSVYRNGTEGYEIATGSNANKLYLGFSPKLPEHLDGEDTDILDEAVNLLGQDDKGGELLDIFGEVINPPDSSASQVPLVQDEIDRGYGFSCSKNRDYLGDTMDSHEDEELKKAIAKDAVSFDEEDTEDTEDIMDKRRCDAQDLNLFMASMNTPRAVISCMPKEQRERFSYLRDEAVRLNEEFRNSNNDPAKLEAAIAAHTAFKAFQALLYNSSHSQRAGKENQEDTEDIMDKLEEKQKTRTCYENQEEAIRGRELEKTHPSRLYTIAESAVLVPKPPEENPTISNLKSVEGRVLTVLEAAISDKEQRNAIKTLIKKEFRREMSKVNRTPDIDAD